MAKKKIKELVEDILANYLTQNNLFLWNVEFTKEAKDWFLRVYIDKDEGYVDIADCEGVSRFLSEALDKDDPIEQNYYLEVSSPGMDRELITDEHYKKYIGHLVEMKLYKAQDGKKNISAILSGVDEKNYYLTTDDSDIKKDITIEKSQVAKTKLAIVI